MDGRTSGTLQFEFAEIVFVLVQIWDMREASLYSLATVSERTNEKFYVWINKKIYIRRRKGGLIAWGCDMYPRAYASIHNKSEGGRDTEARQDNTTVQALMMRQLRALHLFPADTASGDDTGFH